MKMDTDLTGGNLGDAPNENYKKFFIKFSEIDSLPIQEWKVLHILSYFCKKYKETYNIDYKFKFNTPAPSKCFEVFQIKKLSQMLSSNPSILKEYIDWVYLNKVVKAKRRLTSISFMTVEGLVNEYKIKHLFNANQNISRETLLPEKYKVIFSNKGFDLQTYGDLAFLSKMDDFIVVGALQEAELAGLDKSLLLRII
jgi:hypothetical protein